MNTTGKIVLGVAAVAVVGAIGIGVYNYLRPDYVEDFDDDLFDDDDFFEDNETVEDIFKDITGGDDPESEDEMINKKLKEKTDEPVA